MYFDEFDTRKLLVCFMVVFVWLLCIICGIRYIWHNLMVIVLCDWWKCHEYVGGKRVLGFRVETRVIYECLFLGSEHIYLFYWQMAIILEKMIMIVPMEYTQLPNHFLKGFWCPSRSSKVVVYGSICLVKWE